MKIHNPTKETIEVKIFGNNYTLPAEGVLENIPAEVAQYWAGLHGFLKFTEDAKKAAPTVDVTATDNTQKPEAPEEKPKDKTPKVKAPKAK